jgi:ABC-type transporter Mla subunit MlaD
MIMGLTSFAGIAELRTALDTTNSLLQQVLEELRRTNNDSLAQIRDALQGSHATSGQTTVPDPASPSRKPQRQPRTRADS